MLPLDKVQGLISKHSKLEKDLSSGEIDKNTFAIKSKEYSDLNEIIKKIENKVSDYSTTIIEQKIAKSLTITTHYEILNYKISSRVISYFRALWPSVSLTILFHINGLLT